MYWEEFIFQLIRCLAAKHTEFLRPSALLYSTMIDAYDWNFFSS